MGPMFFLAVSPSCYQRPGNQLGPKAVVPNSSLFWREASGFPLHSLQIPTGFLACFPLRANVE